MRLSILRTWKAPKWWLVGAITPVVAVVLAFCATKATRRAPWG